MNTKTTQNAKGATMTKLSRNTKDCIFLIKDSYAKYDKDERRDVVNLEDIPEKQLTELVASYMRDDKARAYEAIGADNPLYDGMHEALLAYLEDIDNIEKRNEFAEIWRYGLVDYLKNEACKILNDR